MDKLFLTILNMSLTGAFVIAAICLVRLPLKKAPKMISYCLWAVAGFRLVFPFSIESVFSLIPFKAQTIPSDIAMQPIPRIDSGIPFVNDAIRNVLPAATLQDSANPLQIWIAIGTFVWLIGTAMMLIYGVVSFIILKRKMRKAAHVESNIYEAKNIKSPFVLGFFKPRIYLPIGLSEQEKGYIILHEQTHIKRHDHIVKFAAYFVLCFHWFNPFAWVAFLLMGVDMEMSCDERVLKEMGDETKKDYSLSLLSLATERMFVGGSPLAFGEDGVKMRIKNILIFKKPSRIIVIVAVLLAVAIGIGLMANRISNDVYGNADPIIMPNLIGLSYPEAKEILKELGLTDIKNEKEDGSSPEIIIEAEWVIASHDPAPGAEITKTTRIILVVKNNFGARETVPLADIERIQMGMTVDEVHGLLGEPHGSLSGFWGDVYFSDDGKRATIYYDGNSETVINILLEHHKTGSDTTIIDVIGIEMIIESVTQNGLSFFFENATEHEYTYGENYSLFVNNNHSWEPVPYITENATFKGIGYMINPNSKTDLTSVDWTWLYGELPSGEYKIQKTILFIRSPGDFDEYVIEQPFSLK